MMSSWWNILRLVLCHEKYMGRTTPQWGRIKTSTTSIFWGHPLNPSDFEAHKGSRVLTNANSHVYIIYIYIYIYMCFVHGDRKLINWFFVPTNSFFETEQVWSTHIVNRWSSDVFGLCPEPREPRELLPRAVPRATCRAPRLVDLHWQDFGSLGLGISWDVWRESGIS